MSTSSPLVAALRALFAQAFLQVSLAGLTEAERARDIAFYDETVAVAVRLCIPASDKTLPPPLDDSQTTFLLPLAEVAQDDDDDDELIKAPPRLLSLLVSALQISLEASYVAPRLRTLSSSATPGQADASSSSNYLIPATLERDAAYQNVPLQRNSNNGEVTPMFAASWNGSKVPKEAGEGYRGRADAQGEKEARNGGEMWYRQEKGQGEWVTEWRCKLPITFVRTRHPTPALLLTASMALRLQPSHLSRLAPSLVPSPTASASESLYLHDLLNPLSEGPSYPDESPAERAARANASLAKLPLGKLPSSILGSKLVTPARNAREVGKIIAEKTKRNAVGNGDVGDSKDVAHFGRRNGRRVLTNDGLMAFKMDVDGGMKTLSDEHAKGLGEEVLVLQRSARRVLDVQSAVLVRMRTTTIPGFPDHEGDGSLTPTLVLCVEVENPVNSGMQFALDCIDIGVSLPHTTARSQVRPIDVSMRRMGDVAEPVVIAQGSQSNLLYQMVFDDADNGIGGDYDVHKVLAESHRNVSIKLLGRPVLLAKAQDGSIASHTSTAKFVSTWTCTLDLSSQMKMVALRRLMHGGAGGDRFASRRSKAAAQRATLAPERHHLTLPASPLSALPSTPTEIQSASTYLAPTPQMLSLRKPSLRAASTMQSDAFVSLHRSESDRLDALSPALPSALVGQSILARARLNRSTTIASGRAEDSRQLLRGKSSKDSFDANQRSASEQTVTPTQRRAGAVSHAHQRGLVEARSGDVEPSGADLLPLGDKRSAHTVHRLLSDGTREQGLLIDLVAHPRADSGQEATVEVQVENRSEQPRTVILSWRTAASPFQADDDDVQVGPLLCGDSEFVTLHLRTTKSGLQQLPALSVYDTTSRVERLLQGLQAIVV